MKQISRLLDLSEFVLSAICVALLAVMFMLGIATVIFRFVVESSLAFPDEMIRYLFVWVVFLGSAVALRRNVHAAIGMFVGWLPDYFRRAVLVVASLVSAIFFVILIVNGTGMVGVVHPQISPALEVSMSYVYAAVPVGSLFMLVYTIELIFRQIWTDPSRASIEDSCK